jgi:hypothetical protein
MTGIRSGPLNACELEIDLFCKGMRLAADVSLDGVRGVNRTRAGLGSGLEVVLTTGSWLKHAIWVNVPVVEEFATRSPYVLEGSLAAGYRLTDERSGDRYGVALPREPAWYGRFTSRDTLMSRVGIMQGTYLAIYLNSVCAFWTYSPRMNCRFCTTGYNVTGESIEQSDKALDDVVETCWAAREESGATFVHLNGGFQGTRGLRMAEPYVRAIKREVGMLVGLQLAPEHDFSKYDRLIDIGIDHLSFCVEFFDPKYFNELCPGKAAMLGHRTFFEAMEYCAARMPKGAVSGEIIAGIEPIESTLAAIDYIADHGAFPTVCIFRPTTGSDMEQWAPPGYDDMRRVMTRVYEACRRNWIPIGAAPNIEVSLVVNPDDTALLAQRGPGFYAYEGFRRSIKWMSRPLFTRKMAAR